MEKQTGGQVHRQVEKQTDGQVERQVKRQTGVQTFLMSLFGVDERLAGERLPGLTPSTDSESKTFSGHS